MKKTQSANIHKKPMSNKLLALGVSVLSLMSATHAQAFLTDSSSKKVIMIGKGGAESMQAMSVPVMETPVQPNHSNYNPNAYTAQHAYANQQAYSQQYPAPAQQYEQTHQTQQYPAQNTYSQPQYSQNAYSQGYDYTQQQPSLAQQYPNNDYQGYGNQFDRLAITTNSAAVVVVDLQTGRSIYEKNINATRSIASVTKMMTAMVAIDSNQSMQEELVISASDLIGAKTASTRLKAGDRLSRADFMLMMLMKSENPAAKTLASHYYGGYQGFISAMNQKAQSLGMTQTRFSDASGLDPRNVSSASDLVKMMREIAINPRYQAIRYYSTRPSHDFYITNYNSGSRTYSANNTSGLVRSGMHQLNASKTGFIREAGYCVVMEANVNGRPSIIVLLGANASQSRWQDAENILGQLAYLR